MIIAELIVGKRLPWPGYLTVHDSPGQDTSLCMTPLARIPHCA